MKIKYAPSTANSGGSNRKQNKTKNEIKTTQEMDKRENLMYSRDQISMG